MTTIIRATGVKFNNDDLPVISPFVTNGLLAAFRPNNSNQGLLDLSGNNHKLDFVGSPQLTAMSVIGNGRNGLISSVPETKDFTIIAVSRIYRNAWNNFDGFIATTFVDMDGNDKDRGVGMFYSQQSNQSNKLDVEITSQTFARETSGGTHHNRYFSTKIAELAKTGNNSDATPVTFHAFTVDTTKRQMFAYNMSQQKAPTNFSDELQQGYDAGQRRLFDPQTYQPNYYHIISNPNYSQWESKVEVFEVLFYNQALTQAEIAQQYQYSKDYMKKHHNIDI